jgi:hypothetical protein
MKVLATLLPLAFADFNQIKNDVVSMVANSSMRGFTGQIGQQVDKLNEYGCWCYFYNDHGRGKGQPVDESDGFCKTLHEGYECAIRDAEDRGDACTPWEVTYVSGINQNAGVAAACADFNAGNDCAIAACTVEGYYVETVFAFAFSGSSPDFDQFSHANGFDADPTQGCPVKKGAGGNYSPERSCCGSYPHRFPFKTLDGERACCGSRTYNTQILKCCGNGQVKTNC